MRDEPSLKVMAGIIGLIVVVMFIMMKCTNSEYEELTLEQYTEIANLSEKCPNVLTASKKAMEFGRIMMKDYEKIKEAGEECVKEGKAKTDAAKIEVQKDKLRRLMNNQ